MEYVPYEAEGWGIGELVFDAGKLVWHELPRPSRKPTPPHANSPGHVSLVRDLQAYFAGKRVDFGEVELDLDWCTPFQRAVADALRGIGYGETVTYGELAAIAGHPNAQRAAGTFCAGNRTPLFVPCHRVVAASGVGSYGSLGIEYKRRLLELERAAL